MRLSRTAVAAVCAFAAFVSRSIAANHVIVIGVEKYIGSTGTNPVRYAENDARLFSGFSVAKNLDPQPVVLESARATLPTVHFELSRILEQAGKGDTVYIFISSRGIARPSLDGYLGTTDMVAERPESTGLPVPYLRSLIKLSSAARVILFADVCRSPAEAFSNQINKRVADLGAITTPAVAGVLASQPGQTSEERADSKYAPGYGLFGFFLVNSGDAGTRGVPGVLSELLKGLSDASRKQKPADFGVSTAKSAPLWRSAIDSPPAPWRPDFPRLQGQFASILWTAGLLAMQTPSNSRLDAIRSELLNRSAPVRDPAGLAQELLYLGKVAPGPEWQDIDVLAVNRLASDAQRVVDNYGMESFLPEDPLRVTTDAANRAAIEFEAAFKLTPDRPTYADFRQSLEVRQYLCKGLAASLPDIGPLLVALRLPAQLPEVHNAIGIHYLESRPADYPAAIREFQAAKQASPGWVYPRHNLALAYIENGDYRAAEREYRDAIATDPLQPYLYYNLGLLLHRMNRRAEAKTAYQQALDSYDQVISRLNARVAEWKNDLPKESFLAATRTGVFEKGRAEVLNARGALRAIGHDIKGARNDYQMAIALNPDLCPARDNLAALEETLAERSNKGSVSPDALQELNENLSRKSCSTFFPSLLRRGRLEQKRGNLKAARMDFESAHKEVPENVESISGMAAIDIANHQFDSATGLLLNAIAIESKSGAMAFPALYVELAEIYRQTGRLDACREAYSNALQAAANVAYDLSKKELRKRAACPPVAR